MENNVTQEGFKTLDDYKKSPAETLQSLERLIKNNIESDRELREKIKSTKEMVDNVLLNDPTYQQHAEVAKSATKVKTATRSEIYKRPDVKNLVEKLKEYRAEKKENKAMTSDLLVEYMRVGKQMTLDFGDGMYQIVQEAKVLKAR